MLLYTEEHGDSTRKLQLLNIVIKETAYKINSEINGLSIYSISRMKSGK